jgi:hypothetical protein
MSNLGAGLKEQTWGEFAVDAFDTF